MPIVSRKVMGTYQHRCGICGHQWVSPTEDGEPEASNHKH
jgi:predicted restriction endonuclease